MTPGNQYLQGSVFTSGSASIKVGVFHLLNGAPATGLSEIQNGRKARGAGNEPGVNNSSLDFNFGAPLQKLEILYGEHGGNINLEGNGALANVPNLADLPPTLGGSRGRSWTTACPASAARFFA